MREFKLVDCKHNNGQKDGASKESKGELGELLLERCPDSQAKNCTDDVDSAPEDTADGLKLALATAERAVGLANAALDLLSDLADLGTKSSRDDDAACTALNNSR